MPTRHRALAGGRSLLPAVLAGLLLLQAGPISAQDSPRHATFHRPLDSSTLTAEQVAAS